MEHSKRSHITTATGLWVTGDSASILNHRKGVSHLLCSGRNPWRDCAIRVSFLQ